MIKVEFVICFHFITVVLPEEHHTRSTTTPRPTLSGCDDLSPNCATYPRDSCTDYEQYSSVNCARTCGFCPGYPIVERPCEDDIGNCAEYGTGMCYSAAEYDWVDSHCRKFCGFCGKYPIPICSHLFFRELLIQQNIPTTKFFTCKICLHLKLSRCFWWPSKTSLEHMSTRHAISITLYSLTIIVLFITGNKTDIVMTTPVPVTVITTGKKCPNIQVSVLASVKL